MSHTEVSKLLWESIFLDIDHKAQYGQNDRVMRWVLVLQQYQFTVKAIKGSENVGADFLSRHSVTSDVFGFLCDGISMCVLCS